MTTGNTQTTPQPQANPLAGVTPWAPCGRPYDHKWCESDTKGVIRIVNVDGALSIAVCDLLRILAWHARWRPEILMHYGWQQPPAAQDDDHAAALQRERERADHAERERDDALRSLGRLVAKDAELARRAVHAALTAQRSDDTARGAGEGVAS